MAVTPAMAKWTLLWMVGLLLCSCGQGASPGTRRLNLLRRSLPFPTDQAEQMAASCFLATAHGSQWRCLQRYRQSTKRDIVRPVTRCPATHSRLWRVCGGLTLPLCTCTGMGDVVVFMDGQQVAAHPGAKDVQEVSVVAAAVGSHTLVVSTK